MRIKDFYSEDNDYIIDYAHLPQTNDPLSIYGVETRVYVAEQTVSKSNMHKHSYYELHYILDGEISYAFSLDNKVKCSKGNWIIVSPQISHSLYRIKQNTIKNSCQFSVGTNDQLNGILKKLVKDTPYITGQITDEMIEIIAKQEKISHNKNIISSWLIRNDILSLILITLSKYMLDNSIMFPHIEEIAHYDTPFYLSLKYIKDNADHHILCEDVVEFSGIYKKKLNKIFQQHLGKNISEVIAEYRIEYAKIELETNKDKTIREISEKLDFCNEYYFSRFFKKHTGKTPNQYRNQ